MDLNFSHMTDVAGDQLIQPEEVAFGIQKMGGDKRDPGELFHSITLDLRPLLFN